MFDDGDYPITMNEVLTDTLFNSLQDELVYWKLTNQSHLDTDPIFWRQDKEYKNQNILFKEAQTIIKYKLMKIIGKNLKSLRVHTNCATSGQRGSVFHTDDFNSGKLTFVLFANPEWNIQWGGESVVFNPYIDKYCYTPFIPNCGVCFPSEWEHYGASPLHHTEEARITIAFLYEIM